MMANLDKYFLAKKDLNYTLAPYRRDNGGFHFTLGLENILGQNKYKVIRQLSNDMENLKKDREEILREIQQYGITYKRIEKEHVESLKILEQDLKRIEEQLELKEAELEGHKEAMQKRGVLLEESNIDNKQNEQKKVGSKKKKWMMSGAMFLIYLVIEIFAFITQINSLRDVMSYEEIASRVVAMGVLVLLFHFMSHLARKSKKPIYRITMGFYLLLISIMMFAPTTLHYIYPESNQIANASLWSLDENTTSVNNNVVSVPTWVELYRKMEWAPAGLGILVFLIVFFVVPNPLFSNKEVEKSIAIDCNEAKLSHAKYGNTWPINKYQQIKKEVQNLNSKKDSKEAQIKQHGTNTEDLLPLQSKLESMKETVGEIEQSIKSKNIEFVEIISAIQNEINEYRTEYEDILFGDQVKQSLLKPEWPKRKDIFKYFGIKNYTL